MGAENHKAVDTYLRGLAKRKKFSKIILIGDLNLNEISWSENSSSNEVQNDFIDTFNDLNFDQLIETSTHINGQILDVQSTSCPEFISDINTKEENEVCKSDHMAIEFSLNVKPIVATCALYAVLNANALYARNTRKEKCVGSAFIYLRNLGRIGKKFKLVNWSSNL